MIRVHTAIMESVTCLLDVVLGIMRTASVYPQEFDMVALWMIDQCTGDPCEYALDGECDVPTYCEAGDVLDCGGLANGM